MPGLTDTADASGDTMDEHAVAGPSGEIVRLRRGRVRSLALVVDRNRYPILSLDSESCLIEAPESAQLRGFAEIFDGEQLTALCLILLAAPEGRARRLHFKQFTSARAEPPRDFAP